MNYIWEILIKAKEGGRSQKDLFFVQAKDCSPWYEQSFPCLNEDMVMNPVVEINSLYRFSEIFQTLLHEMENSEYLKYLFDIGVHVLATQETLMGLSKRDIYLQEILKDLESGKFCPLATQVFQTLSNKQKRNIASLVLIQYETGSSLLIFRQALRIFYPQAMLYQQKVHPEQLLLYPGLTNINRNLILLIEELFLPLEYQMRVFWTKHFGVWDVDATLILDEIEIY